MCHDIPLQYMAIISSLTPSITFNPYYPTKWQVFNCDNAKTLWMWYIYIYVSRERRNWVPGFAIRWWSLEGLSNLIADSHLHICHVHRFGPIAHHTIRYALKSKASTARVRTVFDWEGLQHEFVCITILRRESTNNLKRNLQATPETSYPSNIFQDTGKCPT
jgi:hypothetical protein